MTARQIRGSSGRGHKAVHAESERDPQRGAAASQTAADTERNEITAMRNVLASLDLHGHIVAADTMGTQAAFARQITAPGGDYLAAIRETGDLCTKTCADCQKTGSFWMS